VSAFAVVILPDAEAEARAAFHWYLERSPLAAHAFRTELFAMIDDLTSNAAMWPEHADGVRCVTLQHYPYTVFYEVTEDTATVLSVAHQHRRPGYWRIR
jgi:plasmid stabilization system protein ParE